MPNTQPAQIPKLATGSLTMYALAVAIITKLVALLTGLGEDAAAALAMDLATVALSVVSIIADLVAAYGRKRAEGPVVMKRENL